MKKIEGGRLRIRSTSASQREFGVFVRDGDYCFREKTDGRRDRYFEERETEKDSSIITSFHFNVLDVRTKTAELPPTVKSLDGFFGTDCVIDEFEVPETNLEQD